MKAVVINGSPRKGWNTHQLLKKVEEGLVDNGVDVDFVDLYDLTFTGCRSCFACKIKGSTARGACTYPDDLKPVMDAIRDADVLVLGSPVYLGTISAQMNLLWERLMFANVSYDSGNRERKMRKPKMCALVLSMGAPASFMEESGYRRHFTFLANRLGRTMGYANARLLFCNDTYQFSDYAKYDISPDRMDPVNHDPLHKKRHREQQFPLDLRAAYDLGVELSV